MGLPADEKSKEKADGADVKDQSNERLPSYNQVDQLTLDLPKLRLQEPTPAGIPTVTSDQCVAHLKLLASLADLRDFISANDGLFGISDSEASQFPGSEAEARARIREKRWAVYTARAVDRYTKWWFTGLPMSRPHVRVTDMELYEYETIMDCKTQILWSSDNLPPLGKSKQN